MSLLPASPQPYRGMSDGGMNEGQNDTKVNRKQETAQPLRSGSARGGGKGPIPLHLI